MDKIENSEVNNKTLSRRKALARIGLFAAVAYTVPAFTTLSIAHASGSSDASDASDSSDASDTSDVSETSEVSETSGTSTVSSPSDCEDLEGAALEECLIPFVET